MFGDARILALHQTSESFYPGINNLKPGYFFAVLDLLREFGFSLWQTNEGKDVLDKNLILTFDDGYADNFDILMTLCGDGCSPIVFMPTDFIGKKNSWEYSSRFFPARHLDRRQIAELSAAGVIFGTHGRSHRALTLMPTSQLVDELRSSRSIIEDITGQPVDLLSFPFGRTNRLVNMEALEVGYRAGFALDRPCHSSGDDDDSFILYRLPIYSIDDYYSLSEKVIIHSKSEQRKNETINTLAAGTIITGRR